MKTIQLGQLLTIGEINEASRIVNIDPYPQKALMAMFDRSENIHRNCLIHGVLFEYLGYYLEMVLKDAGLEPSSRHADSSMELPGSPPEGPSVTSSAKA